MAASGKTVNQIMDDHWQKFGRHFYIRHDFEEVDLETAHSITKHLADSLPGLTGKKYGSYEISEGTEYNYHDPVDGSVSKNQGIIISFKNGSRIVYRLSGTSTRGATVRLYIEKYEPDVIKHKQDSQDALKELVAIAYELTNVCQLTGMNKPSVIT